MSGLRRAFVGQIERGLKSPTLRTLESLANSLKVKPSTIIQEAEKLLAD